MSATASAHLSRKTTISGARPGVALLTTPVTTPVATPVATLVAALFMTLLPATTARAHDNPYPTEAIVDYAFACITASGDKANALRRCSCSIDEIARLLPYDDYVKAETVMRMRLVPGGGRASIFRSMTLANQQVERLQAAQAHAEAVCYRER